MNEGNGESGLSKLTLWLGAITVLVLLFSPGGFIGASVQLLAVLALAISVLRDARDDSGDDN